MAMLSQTHKCREEWADESGRGAWISRGGVVAPWALPLQSEEWYDENGANQLYPNVEI